MTGRRFSRVPASFFQAGTQISAATVGKCPFSVFFPVLPRAGNRLFKLTAILFWTGALIATGCGLFDSLIHIWAQCFFCALFPAFALFDLCMVSTFQTSRVSNRKQVC